MNMMDPTVPTILQQHHFVSAVSFKQSINQTFKVLYTIKAQRQIPSATKMQKDIRTNTHPGSQAHTIKIRLN